MITRTTTGLGIMLILTLTAASIGLTGKAERSDGVALNAETRLDASLQSSELPALTEASTGYVMSSYVIAGGGGTSSSGGYSLGGTIGQHDAGAMSGGAPGDEYTLVGGFWVGGADSSEPECSIPADINCDGVVDGLDLLVMLSAWGECADPNDCPADLNNDGTVDGLDLLILLSNWG